MSPARAQARVRFAYCACVGIFLWGIAQFYTPATGFTSLLKIGDEANERETTALRRVPHYVYENSAGYDGAYYVQLALDPLLRSPELTRTVNPPIDNLAYRARRILFSWVAWLAGLGQPDWIVEVHALLNVAAWLGLAVVLLRWFPATNWENFLRWFAVLFSHGMWMSVRDSLVDGPALLLVALGLAAEEAGRRGRAATFLALAGLGRETSLLAISGLGTGDQRPETDDRGVRGFRSLVSGPWSLVSRALLVVLPLLGWVVYLRWRFGPPSETGLKNFALPLAGLAEKWGVAIASLAVRTESTLRWATVGVTLGLTVQFLFFALRWRPRERWWRVGAAFAVLLMFIATPVWEGLPGAAARALLPMTLAFNVLVPRGRAWLAVLLLGNLTVAAGYREFDPPPRDFIDLAGEHEYSTAIEVTPIGWYGAENNPTLHWRWSSGRSTVRIRNHAGRPLTLIFDGRAGGAQDERRLRISLGPAAAPRMDDAMVWSGTLATAPVEFRFGCIVPPGESTLTFASDLPGHTIDNDVRTLAFQIFNLAIVAKPVPGQ